jgi:hypothetical protein
MAVSIAKTKCMAMKGREICSKIVINSQIIEQIKIFKCLANALSIIGKSYLKNNINSFNK